MRKFYSCSVGEYGKDYDEDNLKRIIDKNSFILHENTPQKGDYASIKMGDILLLKYRGRFVAYGEALEIRKTTDIEWNLIAPVIKWFFQDPSEPGTGTGIYGMQDATLGGSQYGTVKPLDAEFSLKKLKEIDKDSPLYNTIMQEIKNDIKMKNIEDKINLLKYKKQIILQGPPGTGKTRLAKDIANKMLRPKTIEIQDIINSIKVGQEIVTVSDRSSFIIQEIKDKELIYRRTSTQKLAGITFADIKKGYANKIWNNVKNGSDTYSAGISKYIYDNYQSDQYKIIQFHPSYTYEDFVRGIVSKPNHEGDGILYEAENKLLGELAKHALDNYRSNSEFDILTTEKSVLEQFISHIIDEIDRSEGGKYHLTDNVYIFFVDNRRLKYKGDNWTAHPNGLNMNFSELEKIIKAGHVERQMINNDESLNALTRQHATYFTKFIEKYIAFKTANPVRKVSSEPLKNFILIIDEINRANLSSVLGELIYALEYRGEEVESIYAVDDKNKITLPPNLYIISTMNTADRSVGHIDYAIKRRFAFVDVLPEINPVHPLIKDEFIKISGLFVKNFDGSTIPKIIEKSDSLAADFRPEDIWIGHSYFICKKEKSDENEDDDKAKPILNMKLKYEIIPLLKEYIRDGILNETEQVKKVMNELISKDFSK